MTITTNNDNYNYNYNDLAKLTNQLTAQLITTVEFQGAYVIHDIPLNMNTQKTKRTHWNPPCISIII